MASPLGRFVYGTTQGLRVSWYFAQKILAARVSDPVDLPVEVRSRLPPSARILRDLRRLLERDLQNIADGLYAWPDDLVDGPVGAVQRSMRFFADLGRVNERRRSGANVEVREAVPAGRYPPYYLQNFHYQTDGYLSRDSAELYDHQVEVLFGGGADAMRRQALVPIWHEMSTKSVRTARLLDVACGTGRFLRDVKNTYPRLAVTGLDLSGPYLETARANLAPWSRCAFVEAAAEAMPVDDGAFDIATCIYLFHELPGKLRRQVASELARILAPGGMLVFVDSLQRGDEPDYDGLLDQFPVLFHEPYFKAYIDDDLLAVFAAAGLRHEATQLAYFSKILTFRKP